MRAPLRCLLLAGALMLLATDAASAVQTVNVQRLSAKVHGSIGVAQAGITVDVALERNHRSAEGELLEHVAVASASATTDAAGDWSVELLRPWGADPRDQLAVRYGGAPAGIGDVDVSALSPSGARVPGLFPSSVGWSADGTGLTVDCGDTDAGVAGACDGVGATVAGRPGVATGTLVSGSARIWQISFLAALSIDDHVILSEARTIHDVDGQPVRLIVSRDAGMPRGGDPTVQRVPGVAPRCSVSLDSDRLECLDLDARATYTANGVALAYAPVSATFGARLARMVGGETVEVRRTGAASALTVLHVAPIRGGTCAPGDWLGRVSVASDLLRTQICPGTGRMAGMDSADVQMDELSGGWTIAPGPTESVIAGTTPPPPGHGVAVQCAVCVMTLRSARVNAVMHLRRTDRGMVGTAMLVARVGTRTARRLGKVTEGRGGLLLTGDRELRFDVGAGGRYSLRTLDRQTTGSATIAVRSTRAGDAAIIAAAKRLARALRRRGHATLRLDAPFAQHTTVTFRVGRRTVRKHEVRLLAAVRRDLKLTRPKGARSVNVQTIDALGARTRVSVRL